jgi:hypothetical protein
MKKFWKIVNPSNFQNPVSLASSKFRKLFMTAPPTTFRISWEELSLRTQVAFRKIAFWWSSFNAIFENHWNFDIKVSKNQHCSNRKYWFNIIDHKRKATSGWYCTFQNCLNKVFIVCTVTKYWGLIGSDANTFLILRRINDDSGWLLSMWSLFYKFECCLKGKLFCAR